MNLESQLTHLETAQLVRRVGEEQATYIFKHALTQDAAYQSLLQKQRREIHRQVARAYEAEYGNSCLDDYAGILAQHYAQAGDDAQAFDYSVRAGDNAARTYANAEAILQYNRAIEIARRNAETLRTFPTSLQQLFLKRGRAFELSSQYAQAVASYVEMAQVAREQNDRAMELAALIAHATLRATPTPMNDWGQAETLLDHALHLATDLGDRAAESKILWNQMLLYKFAGDAPQGMPYGERSLAIARELNLREQMAFTLNDLGVHAYAETGQTQRALEAMAEARHLWQSMNNQPMLADTLGNMAVLNCTLGNYTEAIDLGHQARRISESIGNLWGQSYCRFVRGEIEWDYGDLHNALTTMQECIQLAQQAGFTAPLVWVRNDLAMAYANLGQIDQAIVIAQQALESAETQFRNWKMWAVAVLARLELRRGNLEQASTHLDHILTGLGTNFIGRTWFHMTIAIGMLRAEIAMARREPSQVIETLELHLAHLNQTGARHFVPEVLTLQAQAFVLDKQLDRARATLVQARAIAETLGSKWHLWHILAALAEIEEANGHTDQANMFCGQAREILEFIVSRTPNDLRESFMNLPNVKSILNPG